MARFRLLLLPGLALAAGFLGAATRDSGPVLEVGGHRFLWQDDWGRSPEAPEWGNTHGAVLIRSGGELLFNTDTEAAVVELTPGGELRRRFGKDWKGGLHGMALVVRDGEERLYVAHTALHEVAWMDLEGRVLGRRGWPEECGHYQAAGEYRPTAVAVAGDGSFYVADGYGRGFIHHFAADGAWIRSWGGPGEEPGRFRTPHGVFLHRRQDGERLIVADRENHRLQVFDLEGRFLQEVKAGLRRPCGVAEWQEGGLLVVADLAGRITLLDEDYRLIGHLGDQPDPSLRARNGVPREVWRPGEFLAPHSACFDREGNLYVLDWLSSGRITRLKRLRPEEEG